LGNLCVAASRLGLAEADTEDSQRSDSLQARLFHLDREQLTVQVPRDSGSLVGTGFVLGFDLDRTLIFYFCIQLQTTRLLIFCSMGVGKCIFLTNHGKNHSLNIILAVFRIHDISVWIRIRIRGSMPLTNGSGSIPLTSGSGSGRPKNSWIRIRIRIRNTVN
jgi:hypothetical protein